MRFAVLLFFFIFRTSSLNAQTYIERYGDFDTIKYDVHVEIANEVRQWYDSLHYRFQVVSFSGIPTNHNISDPGGFLRNLGYSEFNGPVFLRDKKNCSIYPMNFENISFDTLNRTKTVEALFCMEDFQRLTDSITVLCEGYYGYINRSQMNTMYIRKEIEVDESMFDFDEDKSYPIATEIWFQNYRIDHYRKHRTTIWYGDKRHYCD